MKKYRAVFFDWDGTAVSSRKAPVEEVSARMGRLLDQGIKLAVISGTTIENIGGGTLHLHFTPAQRAGLFYGLGRGAYNYRFTPEGEPEIFDSRVPDRKTLLLIHQACFELHQQLLERYGFETDIVFSRPNYCKVDILVGSDRGDQLYFKDSELDLLKERLETHGFEGGLGGLLEMAREAGRRWGLELSATTDAKYLEIGPTSKSDNVDAILGCMKEQYGISPNECCFWGDEYAGMDQGLYGSDSFMITSDSCPGDFFDVSASTGVRPEGVKVLGGGVKTFLDFLESQAAEIAFI